MKKLIFALFALVLSTEVFAQTVSDFYLPARANGGKVVIAPKDAGGTSQTMLTADPVAGTLTAAKPIVQVDYVGTNPEVGGSSPFQLAPNHKRHQIINPAGAITVKLPTTAQIGEVWKITNRSVNKVSIYDSTGSFYVNEITFGTIELVALSATPQGTGTWQITRAETQWVPFTPAWTNRGNKGINSGRNNGKYRRIANTMEISSSTELDSTASGGRSNGLYPNLPTGTIDTSQIGLMVGWSTILGEAYTYGIGGVGFVSAAGAIVMDNGGAYKLVANNSGVTTDTINNTNVLEISVHYFMPITEWKMNP